jgi:hypothetical protein
MTASPAARGALIQTLTRVNEAVTAVDDEVFYRRTWPTQPPIAFHVWHVARWMDYYRDVLVGPDTQIWDSEGLAARWNLDPSVLGADATGMGMGDEASASMVLPERSEIMAYCERVIDALTSTLASLTPAQLDEEYKGHRADLWRRQGIGTVSVGATLIAQLTHANRHLGMIEALKGSMGQSGSATV